MDKRHVVVTGGASGLGLGCVAHFHRLGYRITIADIDLAGAQRAIAQRGADPATLRAEALDLADPASIAAFAERMHARGDAIDVLVNNAGIYPPARRVVTPDGHELTFAIAHLGHFRLTHALWPLLERADAARVVSVSSMVQRHARLDLDDLACARAYEPIVAYQRAKLACLLFALELQRRLSTANSRITSCAAHPGVCRTQIGRNRRRSQHDNFLQRTATALLGGGLRYVGQSPENGARPVVAVATADLFPAGSFAGPRWLFESFGAPVRSQPGAAARDPALARRLWERSEAITGLHWSIGAT
ncbi:MAG TPA: SDR family NAD(P)-dependent oxidoreductase [Solimonas sp.]|nr:SDR family NAD(P)-dependent oxidoreductase [Solimonas sp.]